MIYTVKTKKAMNICYDAHAGQYDKSGMPYIFHPIHVAEQMDDEASTIVALLHDVVEDTEVTFDDLRKEGFGEEVMAALELLTHEDGVPYYDYIRKIKSNEIATKVKLADLTHNSDLTRLLREPEEKDLERVEKYNTSRKILSGEIE